MPITTTICNSFKLEALQGVHNSTDIYKIALYTSAATLDKNTTVYSTTNEVSGTGYVAGGISLSGFTSPQPLDTQPEPLATQPVAITEHLSVVDEEIKSLMLVSIDREKKRRARLAMTLLLDAA